MCNKQQGVVFKVIIMDLSLYYVDLLYWKERK
jgi:hypothetical protein